MKTPDPEHTWTLLHRFAQRHDRRGELADALGFRLGGGRGRILLQLRTGPRTLTELATTNGFDAPYATVVVDKLEEHGLVERRPHPDDRRRKLVALTAAGTEAVETVDTILRRPPPAMSGLTPAELEQLAALLERLHAVDSGWHDD